MHKKHGRSAWNLLSSAEFPSLFQKLPLLVLHVLLLSYAPDPFPPAVPHPMPPEMQCLFFLRSVHRLFSDLLTLLRNGGQIPGRISPHLLQDGSVRSKAPEDPLFPSRSDPEDAQCPRRSSPVSSHKPLCSRLSRA